jgi:polysaccharide biosynthesis protein PslH
MRILWVKIGGLWPLDTGGRLRSFHLIAELAKRHSVTLATTRDPAIAEDAVAARLPHGVRLVSVPWTAPKFGTARFALAFLRSLASARPVDLAKFEVPDLARRVAQILAARQADLCVADFLSATPNVPFGGAVPVVLFAHNVEHLIWRRLSEVEDRPWRRPALALEWRKMRRAESEACRVADLTVAVSDVDRALLAATAPGAAVRAIPTGVDTSYFCPNGWHERPERLVFVGSMDWYPNEDAALYFMEEILPRIRQTVPGASLSLVGRNPSARLRQAAARTGATLTGTVEDVRPHLAEAAVCVVPLRVGGGTRLKIFEALALGKAVVSTGIGAEGLPVVPDEHLLLAEAPAEFARAVVALLRDPARRRALGAAGRGLVQSRYSWAQVAREFERTCGEALGHHAR